MIGPAANGRFHGNGARGDGYGARYRGDPRRFSAYSLNALWDALLGITLNGTDVSAWASQVAGALDLSQATGANQPLYTGAPTYNGQPSIQHTAANSDRLFRINTDPIGAGPSCVIMVVNPRTAAGRLMSIAAGDATGEGIQIAGGNWDFVAWAVADRNDGVVSAGQLMVLIFRDTPGVTASVLANGILTILTGGTAARTAPGATATVSIGAGAGGAAPADIDVCFAGIFASSPDVSVIGRISEGLSARFGIAA